MKLKQLVGILVLFAGVCANVNAAISADSGAHFQAYAFTAGLMDQLASKCLTNADPLRKGVLSSSSHLKSSLTHYGMPSSAFETSYVTGSKQVDYILSKKSTKELCVQSAVDQLEKWEDSVTTVVEKLAEEDAAP